MAFVGRECSKLKSKRYRNAQLAKAVRFLFTFTWFLLFLSLQK